MVKTGNTQLHLMTFVLCAIVLLMSVHGPASVQAKSAPATVTATLPAVDVVTPVETETTEPAADKLDKPDKPEKPPGVAQIEVVYDPLLKAYGFVKNGLFGDHLCY